jgi:hypothetical protein
MQIKTAIFLTCILCFSNAEAQDNEVEISPVLLLGLTYGGDTLADVELDDAPDEKIKTGGLLYLGGGLNFSQAESPWSLQVNLAYHFDYSEGDLEQIKGVRAVLN